MSGFRLEGVTVCVDFADILAETLPHNQKHFDDFMVITAPEDLETQQVCRYYGARFCLTDKFRSRWGEFHKAKGINHGLNLLRMSDWVIHMDVDVILPPQTRSLIENADLHKFMLYGAHRFSVQGHDMWRKHQAMPPLQQDDYHVNMDAFPILPAFSGKRMRGYAPPGYFQLWNPRGSKVYWYPDEHNGAQKTDVLFTAKWPRKNRHLLPEFVVYHLEPEPTVQGANWGGRVTSRFGVEPDEKWCPDRRHHRHHHHHEHHHCDHHHHHPEPYCDGPE